MARRGLASLLSLRRGHTGLNGDSGSIGVGPFVDGIRGLVPHCYLSTGRGVRGGRGGGGGSDEHRRKALHAQVLAGVPREKSAATKAAMGDRPLLLDTHALVVALENTGMSRAQSAAIADALVSVSAAASQHARDQTVSKSSFSDLRAELSILEKADFAVLKGDIAGLYVHTPRMRALMRNELKLTQYIQSEKRLDTAVAQLYTEGERIENRIIKWVVALAVAVAFGLMRLTGTGTINSTQTKSKEDNS